MIRWRSMRFITLKFIWFLFLFRLDVSFDFIMVYIRFFLLAKSFRYSILLIFLFFFFSWLFLSYCWSLFCILIVEKLNLLTKRKMMSSIACVLYANFVRQIWLADECEFRTKIKDKIHSRVRSSRNLLFSTFCIFNWSIHMRFRSLVSVALIFVCCCCSLFIHDVVWFLFYSFSVLLFIAVQN